MTSRVCRFSLGSSSFCGFFVSQQQKFSYLSPLIAGIFVLLECMLMTNKHVCLFGPLFLCKSNHFSCSLSSFLAQLLILPNRPGNVLSVNLELNIAVQHNCDPTFAWIVCPHIACQRFLCERFRDFSQNHKPFASFSTWVDSPTPSFWARGRHLALESRAQHVCTFSEGTNLGSECKLTERWWPRN